MKREIKFRAWDPLNKYFVTCNFNTRIKVVVSDLYEKGFVQQFTGLHDKNGKEIYEGDIVRYLARYPKDFQERNPSKKHGRIAGPVTWTDGWLFATPPIEGKPNDDTLLYKGESEQWEIIGNIYENPELLK